jgi:Protein of unknown function (DUF1064)
MGNEHVDLDGYSFGSKLEAAVYQMLKLRMKAGEIASIQVQDHITICGPAGHECPRKVEYISDFKCGQFDGTSFWVEAKGFENDRWPMKKTLWKHYGPGRLEIWKGTYRNPVLVETVYSFEPWGG